MQRVLAALIFFTRLPFWRLGNPPAECYKRVVELWPLSGWLTGGVAALTLWLALFIVPLQVAVVMALAARLLVTGALHEDGLADFCDGMGGGTTRQRTLEIMKDSHIGTYGVIGLILYYLLAVGLLSAMEPWTACVTLLCADTWGKTCASQIINFLPYARKEEEAKNRTVYTRMAPAMWLINLISGALPLLLLPEGALLGAAIFPAITAWGLISLMSKRLQGYTGDCCGATSLLCELSFYIGILVFSHFL